MAIESSLAVGTDIEHLGEFKGVGIVHDETSGNKDEHASLDGSLLHILVIDGVDDGLEPKRFNFFTDALDTLISITAIGHDAAVVVEINQVLPILHDRCVILCQKLFRNFFKVHSNKYYL
eukprot:GHVR01098878.1.p2 GENE.GHVR01098878.1~~GHVR01098878.1.p2  ORF type:complete len:120 (+),score=6.03 GHVR01098878.1:1058-1417(+)